MLKIVKIGGNIVDNPAKLRAFLVDFAALDGDKILVHGGGKVATAISSALGIETTMIDGRRVTDRQTLEVVTMVYNGINKQIVSTLQGLGCNAVGLCGADGQLVVSRRRSPEPIDYGFVGDPVSVNVTFAESLIKQGFTLVVAPITYDGRVGESRERGELLNTNADTVAQTIAVAMANGSCNMEQSDECNMEQSGADVELVYCFEKQGVLADVNDEDSVIPLIDRAKFAELKTAGTVHSGMLPKLENAFRALDGGGQKNGGAERSRGSRGSRGVQKVVICAAENIAKPGYGGTTIVG